MNDQIINQMKIRITDKGGLDIVFYTDYDVNSYHDDDQSLSYKTDKWVVSEFSNQFIEAIQNVRVEKSLSFDDIKIAIKQLTKHGQNASLTETKLAYGHAVSLLEGLIKDE